MTLFPKKPAPRTWHAKLGIKVGDRFQEVERGDWWRVESASHGQVNLGSSRWAGAHRIRSEQELRDTFDVRTK